MAFQKQAWAKKQARKLQATLVRNYDSLTHLLAHGGEV